MSLALAGAVVVLIAGVAIAGFPNAVAVLACLVLAVILLTEALVRRGPLQLMAATAGVLALGGALVLVLAQGRVVECSVIVAGAGASIASARIVFSPKVELAAAGRPLRPVLFYNPLSGGGKATRFKLAEEARRRGIVPIKFNPGEDLEALVRKAADRGADALAMAGGDGSQAVVAAIAADLDLPYACIPAGTRNHFALDLGVDRDDVVGALDAFVDGGERRVDLAEVNGRVFVNNVSLGVYAEAVQQAGYRDAKLRTLVKTAPEALGPGPRRSDLRVGGADGAEDEQAIAVLVSNNQYRLGRVVGSGTRPRLDAGTLGVTFLGLPRHRGPRALVRPPWRQWSSPTIRVDSRTSVAAGIDGEAVSLEPPLRFRSLPRSLRVRIAPRHPGASPSAAAPSGLLDAARALAATVAGRPSTSSDASPTALANGVSADD
ncbi:MAG: diacylglycerol/lipid kinase family protein [Solirubrobacterales bacterium]